jgi:hypothetical protein
MFDWSRGVVPPIGWLWLPDGLQHLALLAFGQRFGDEHGKQIEHPLPPFFVLSASDLAQENPLEGLTAEATAPLITHMLCRALNEAVLNGRVEAAYTPKGAGDLVPMPLGAWRVDDPYTRYRGGHYNSGDLMAADEDQQYRVLVKLDDVTKLALELLAWVRSLPRFSEARNLEDGACRFGSFPGLPAKSVRQHVIVLDATDFFYLSQRDSMVAANDDCLRNHRTGLPGRPGAWHIVEAEHLRRKEANLAATTKTAEAEALLAYYAAYRDKHPDAPPLTAKTIKNRLGPYIHRT